MQDNKEEDIPAIVSIDPNNTVFAAVKENYFRQITKMMLAPVKGADASKLLGYMQQIITPDVRIVCVEQQFGSRTLCTIQGMLVGLAKALNPKAKVIVVNANHYKTLLGVKRYKYDKNKEVTKEAFKVIEDYFAQHPEDNTSPPETEVHHINDCLYMNEYIMEHYLQ